MANHSPGKTASTSPVKTMVLLSHVGQGTGWSRSSVSTRTSRRIRCPSAHWAHVAFVFEEFSMQRLSVEHVAGFSQIEGTGASKRTNFGDPSADEPIQRNSDRLPRSV